MIDNAFFLNIPECNICNSYCFLLDLNECLTNNGKCEHICTNNDGSYECSCNSGYEIGNDGKSCEGKQEF